MGNNPKDEPRITHKSGEPKQKKHTRKGKVSEKSPKSVSEITTRHPAEEMSNQAGGSEELRDPQDHSRTNLDSLRVRRSSELVETSEESQSGVNDRKQTEKLDWFSTWEED